MEWRNSKMREANRHLDAAYRCVKEMRDDGVRGGTAAGSRELTDAMDLLALAGRMAMRGSKDLYIWEHHGREMKSVNSDAEKGVCGECAGRS